MRVLLLLLGIAVALPIVGQDDKPQPEAKPRVFIAAGTAWRKNGPGSSSKSELEYRRVEIAGDFSRSCGATIVVTTNIKDAYYVAEFSRHATGVPLPAIAVNRTDVNVYRTNADLVGASSKSSLGGAVKAACEVMTKDWPNAPRDLTPKRRDVRPTGRTASFPQ